MPVSDIQRSVSTQSLTPDELTNTLGVLNSNLKQLENRLSVRISQRSDHLVVSGSIDNVSRSEHLLLKLIDAADDRSMTPEALHVMIQGSQTETLIVDKDDSNVHLTTRKGRIYPRGQNQRGYVRKILTSDVSFGVGPAGTGKTYLAVAAAVDMLERGEIERILLVRPAVEAGEKLGFLPGDLTQKIDPYLRPLYDALYEMLGFERVGKMIERQVIEVAPLAYMRGRTLNNSFVILDEAQNTTPEQMKMFLTRLGFGSRAVITGDITQVDLPRGHRSGLGHALKVLEPISEIHITRFDSKDVVRHQLVQKIVEAYEMYDLIEEPAKH